ncbi:hypothetical protein C2W62_12650 [Candidatus Entotheonella serta]|nr:hypothetical protein C2W62_12650 [Candidatus Entotheonella serta]
MYTDTLRRRACTRLIKSLVFIFAAIFGPLSPYASSTAEVNILLAEPLQGSFTTASETLVSGRVELMDLSGAVLTMNGHVVPLAADGAFSHLIALDAERIFNPVLVDLTVADNIVARRRPVVIVGTALPETSLSPESLATRLTDRGLDQLAIRALNLDITEFLPPGPLFSEELCVEIPLLPDICTDVAVTIDDNPAPRFGSVELALDADVNQVNLELTLRDLFVSAEVEAEAISCTVTVNADALQINGAIHLGTLQN